MITPRDELLTRQNELKSVRNRLEGTWRKIAKLLRPDDTEFWGVGAAEPVRRDEEIFDSTPLYALDAFVGGLFNQATNPVDRWFELGVADDPDLSKWGPVKTWLWGTASHLYTTLSPSVSGFYATAPAWFSDVGAFGLGALGQEEDLRNSRIIDAAVPLREIFIDVDAAGEIDTVHRERKLKGRQFKKRYRNYPETCKDQDSYTVIRCVRKNEDYNPQKFGDWPWLSTVICTELRDWRMDGGHHDLPFHIPMWNKRSGSAYPSGPGHIARADMQMLQEMARSKIVAAQFDAEPPWLAHDNSKLTAEDVVPNAFLYGAMGENGKRLAEPMERKSNLALTHHEIEQRRSAIRDAFYFSIMQLINRPQMTATEFLGFQEEKLKLMGPNLVRIQTGGLSPFVARRFMIQWRAGKIPPPPPELGGKGIDIVYVSPLAKAQKAAVARGTLQWVTALGNVAAATQDPSVMDNVEGDATARVLHDAFVGVPDVLRQPDAVAQLRQSRAAASQPDIALERTAKGVTIAAEAAHAAQAATLSSARNGLAANANGRAA